MRKLDGSESSPSGRVLWLPLGLVVLAVLFRLLKGSEAGMDWLPNVSPWMALALAGTALFPRAVPGWLVLAGMVGVDLLVQGDVILAHAGSMAVVYGCLAAAAIWGGRLREQASGGLLLGATAVCSIAFYLVTNTAAWMASPAYAGTLSGWVQALTTGLPGYPPTWLFLRNSLASDLGFAVLLLIAHNAEARVRHLNPLRWLAVAS